MKVQSSVSRMMAPPVKIGEALHASRIDFTKEWGPLFQSHKNVNVLHIPQVKLGGGAICQVVKSEASPQLNVVRSPPPVVKAEPLDEKPSENVVRWHACRRNDTEESVATSPREPAAAALQARGDALGKMDGDGEVENDEVTKEDWKEVGKNWKEKEEKECRPVSPLRCQEPRPINEPAIWIPFAPTVSEGTRTKPPTETRLVASKFCSSCHTRKTPLWRDGPTGPKSLCNACGLRHQRGRSEGKTHKRKAPKDGRKSVPHKKTSAVPKRMWPEDSDSGASTKEVSGITAVSSGEAPASKCVQAVRGSSPLSSMGASGQSADKSWKRVKRPSEKLLESSLICGGEVRRTGIISIGSGASPSWRTAQQCYRCMTQYKFQLRDGPDGANTLCNTCFHRLAEVQRSPPPSSGDESEDVDLRGEGEEVSEMDISEDSKPEEVVITGWGAVHKRKRMTCSGDSHPVVRRRYFGSFPVAMLGDSSGNSSPCESDDAAGLDSPPDLKSGGMSPIDVEEDKALSRSGSAVDLTKLSSLPKPGFDVQRIAEEMERLEKITEDAEKVVMEWKHGKRVPMESPRTTTILHSQKQFPGKRIKLVYGGGKVRPMKRCVCCNAEATPQWREGPKGPKTLCNACGLRFAKGRVCNHHRSSKASSGVKKLKLTFGSVEKAKKEEMEDREFVPRGVEPVMVQQQQQPQQGLGLEVEGKRRRKKINRAALDDEMDRGSDREARKKSKKAKQNRKKAEQSVKKLSKKAVDGWGLGSLSCSSADVQELLGGGMEAEKRGLAAPQIRRRCTHCFQDRTPLWREGPLGPKTLCNACGIMHKRGRLDPSKCHPVAEMDDDMPIMAMDFGRGKAKGGSCGKAGAPKKPRASKEGGVMKVKKPRAKKVEKDGDKIAQRQRHVHMSGLSMIPMDIGVNDWAEGLGELEQQRLCAKLGSETESDSEDYPRLPRSGTNNGGWTKARKAAGESDWSSEDGLSGLWAQDSFDADEEGLLDDLPEVHELLDSDDIIAGLGSGEFPWVFGDPLDNLDTVTQCDVESWEVTDNWILTERPAAQAAKA